MPGDHAAQRRPHAEPHADQEHDDRDRDRGEDDDAELQLQRRQRIERTLRRSGRFTTAPSSTA